jgi:quercetin dioxygenase-like cupin family protein
MAYPGTLPPIQRYITTHNSDGKAIFSNLFPSTLPPILLPDASTALLLGYTTAGFPAELNNEADLTTYEDHMKNDPGFTIPNGTVLRYVDMAPGSLAPMHRTMSLDYAIALEGEVELVLDGEERRILKRGDVAIQRGTIHAWHNVSNTEWARVVFVMQPCKQVEIGGKKLGEVFHNPIEAKQ